MARNSLCALNEISAMIAEDQNRLLDIMEEGEHTPNKYHFHTKIKSPTVIIASTNLTEYRGEYFDSGSGKISMDQINLQKQLLDRFDLIVVLKDNGSIEAVKEYTKQKIQLQSKPIPRYDTFLQKYLEYARQIEPEISPEAANMIGNYYIDLHKSNPHLKSKRVFETLFRLSKTVAKLRLKLIVDSEDVIHATKFYNVLVNCYLPSVAIIPQNPMTQCIEICTSILQKNGDPMFFSETIKEACHESEHVRLYLLSSQSTKSEEFLLTPDKNKKVRKVRDTLKADQKIIIVNQNPLKLQYRQESNKDRGTLALSPPQSDRSDRSDAISESIL